MKRFKFKMIQNIIRRLVSIVYKFFDKKSSGKGVDTVQIYQLANKIYKQIIKKFIRWKVIYLFRDNIWGVDLADMQSLSKYNRGIRYLLRAIHFFSKYV